MVDFIELNVTALRKILKKFDKNFPHHRLSATYFRQYRRTGGDGIDDAVRGSISVPTDGVGTGAGDQDMSHLDQLYHYGGLSALLLTLRRSFDELHQLELNLMILDTALQGHHIRHKKSQSTSALPSTIGHYGTITDDDYDDEQGKTHPLLVDRQESGDSTSMAAAAAAEAADEMLTPIAKSRKEFPLPRLPPPTTSRKTTTTTSTTTTAAATTRPVADHRRTATVSGAETASADVLGQQQLRPFSMNPPKKSSTQDTSYRSSTTSGRANKPFLLLDTSRYGTSNKRSIINNLPSLETTITKRREPILDKIRDARNRLQTTTKYAEIVAAQALVEEETARVPESEKVPVEEFTRTQRISSFLNLMSTFLYMTNYYVVAPTVGDYAVLLGQSEAMAGIIIGMTPNAALLATVLYGWWSNHSYRHALIFAATCSVLGNVFYALALSQNSLTMVLIGRFLNGFGSARSINRRYIADAFSKADRTAASAAFVTSGALGMAAGPGTTRKNQI